MRDHQAIVEYGTGWHDDQYRVLVYGRAGTYSQIGWHIDSHHSTLAAAQRRRDQINRGESSE